MCLTKSPFHGSLKSFKKIFFFFLNPQQAHSLLKLEGFGILLLSLSVPSLKKNLWWQSWHSRIMFIVHYYASGKADMTSPPFFRP